MKKTTFNLNRSSLLIYFMLLTTTLSFAQPANDDCSTATPLTVGLSCTNIIGTNVAATDSAIADPTIPAPTCASYAGGDVWFSVVVPATGGVIVETNTDDDSITDGGMAIYTGSCTNLVQYACDDDSNDAIQNFERISVIETAGSTIFVRVWSYNNLEAGTFNICAIEFTPTPATNDDCVDAIALTAGETCVVSFGTNLDATDSALADPTIPAPGCASYNGGDVWFSVIVPASGNLAVETSEDDGSIVDGGLALYTGTCAASGLALLACDDDGTTGTGAFERIELMGRTPGQTIYARVWVFNNEAVGTFEICATELSPLSTQEESRSAFKVYPNPANNVVNIRLSNANDLFTVAVYDLQGKLVLTAENKAQLNTSTLTSGMYFVKVTTTAGEATQKLIIE